MSHQSANDSLQTLQDIRGIMERSSRFLSLSGWSGVWAGGSAIAGAAVAYQWMKESTFYRGTIPWNFVLLAFTVLVVALAGGFFFTWRKARLEGNNVWNRASKQLAMQGAIPLAAGGIFAYALLYYGQPRFVAPACLMFYGLALINASKHTLGEIRALGLLELILGSINLFMPYYGLILWAIGFGVLHIVYGILMWNKYDRRKEPGTEESTR